jgi:pimeloyl-ACP methyl ester carboxylesterase
MKTSQIVLQILVFYISACGNRTPTGTDNIVKDTTVALSIPAPASLEAGKIIDPVTCKSDPTQSYALYIPAKGNKTALPVIYFFDPHADGELPVNKYKSLADAYGFILIGSNNSKNGNDWSTTENVWRHLSDDTRDRLKIDSSLIYTCGFSGGAKVAGYVALNHPGVKGVIANGAGLPDGTPAGDFPFSFTAVTGEGDMNMTELVAITGDLDKTRTPHRIIFFDGKHEWAPENTMQLSFAGLQFDAMRSKLIPTDEAFISRYIAGSKMRLDGYYKANQLIKAEQECKLSISFLDGLTDEAGWFREKEARLLGNALYRQQRQAQDNFLVTEQNTKAEYMQHFQQDDMPYWAKTIADLQTKANAKTAGREMYQRLLAYLSLAFYSLSNHYLVSGNENAEAAHFVELYKMADSTNSEAWYFSAMLHARDGHTEAAENDLLKAVEYGFKDENRMIQQPEFQTLSPPMNFSRIEGSMHRPVKQDG